MKNAFYREFLSELSSIKSLSELSDFLHGIFTPKELEEIPLRLQIVKLLKGGMPQHAIAEKLGVGIATVTRGSKELAQGRFKTVKSSTWR